MNQAGHRRRPVEWEKIMRLLLSPDVSEIQTNGPDSFFYKVKGRRQQFTDFPQITDEEYIQGIEDGLVPHVRQLMKFDPNKYLFEGPLNLKHDNGIIRGRCHIVLPPATDYAQVTIAKKSTSLATLDVIAAGGSMSTEMLVFLKAAMKANLTICLSGGTGAGKDVSVETLIPTSTGLKKAGDIQIGETIYDENGKPTIVVNKYKPLDPEHYELTFRDGQKIRAGMGHLWKVLELTKKVNYGYKTKSLISDDIAISIKKLLLTSSDGFITSNELCKILKVKNIRGPLSDAVKGFGTNGGEFFDFEKNSLVSRIQEMHFIGENAKSKEEIVNAILAVESDTVTLNQLKSIVDNRYLVNRIVPGMHDSKTFIFNRREVLTHILKVNDERLYAREMLDDSSDNVHRPVRLMTTGEMFDAGARNASGRLNFAINVVSSPVEYEAKELPIHPYTLGAWLGDGYSESGRICGKDTAIFERLVSSGYEIINREYKNGNGTLFVATVQGLKEELKNLDLLNNKHIPNEYKISSIEQRKQLISGLVDTDGTVDKHKGTVILELTNKSIVQAAREIIASLGWKPTEIISRARGYKNDNGEYIECQDGHRFSFLPVEQIFNVQSKAEILNRHLESNKQQTVRYERHYITDIQEINAAPEDYVCFGVDSPTHMFLIGESFIPTHNTTMLEACSKLIPEQTRIGVAEDTPELDLIQPNVTYLHSVPWQPGMNPNDVATLSWVVQQFQRMRTDRVIIGETRGKEFADFLIAANSGMEGSMTTIHANDAKSCLTKMTNFATKGSIAQPIRSINRDIAGAIDLIVQLIYTEDGKYRMSKIEFITETLANNDEATITTDPVYEYIPQHDGFRRIGALNDKLKDRLRLKGVDLSPFEDPQTFGKIHSGHTATHVAIDESNSGGVTRRSGIPNPPPGFMGRRGM